MSGDKTITELTTLATVDHNADWLPVVDASDTTDSIYGTTKKALVDQFVGDKGDTGIGTIGATGVGTVGATGVGEKGDTGADSTVQGDTGIGTKGDTGVGQKGDTGVGQKGDTGVSIKGDTGIGTQGATGIGTVGATGVGTVGATGVAGAGVDWKGVWSGPTTYIINDGVSYNGSSYISKQDNNIGHLPTDTNWWDVWVAKGEGGDQGDTGVGVVGATGVGTVGATGVQGETGVAGQFAGQLYWFHNDASDIATYETFQRIPANATEVDESVTCTNANTEYLIDSYATLTGVPGVSMIPAGLWKFFMYHYVNVATPGDARFVYRVYKRDTGGTETEIFNVTSAEVNGTSATEYTTNYTLVADYPLATTDRIIIKVFAKNTTAGRVGHFVYEGSTNASYIITSLGISAIKGDTGTSIKGDTGVSVQGDTGVGQKGDTGDAGSAGVQGDTGIGATGSVGATGVSGTSYDWEGAWVTSTVYALNDTVQNDGSGYVCTSGHTSGASTEPGVGASWTTVWDLLVEGVGGNSVQIDSSGGTSDTYGVLSGLVNGSNTVYTVSLGSYVSGSLQVYLNGQLLTQGSSEDWTETTPNSGTFTFITAPTTGDIIIVMYQFSSGATGNADTLDNLHSSSFALNSEWVSGWKSVADTWTYASADAPTFVITAPSGAASLYSVGMKIRLTQTTVKYFIITAITDTTLSVYGGTDYTLVDAAISAISYSVVRSPHGFPINPNLWTVELADTSQRSQANAAQNTWYNLGSLSISIPIGVWNISYKVPCNVYITSTVGFVMEVTLSTGNNSETDAEMSTITYLNDSTNIGKQFKSTVYAQTVYSLASKTAYYLNARTTTAGTPTIYFDGDLVTTIVRAVCAYL